LVFVIVYFFHINKGTLSPRRQVLEKRSGHEKMHESKTPQIHFIFK